jgi:hypothetical protein
MTPPEPLGHLVTRDDAEKLRLLRNQQYQHPYQPSWAGDFVPVAEPGGPLYMLYVRDVIPFEDENGNAHFEVPNSE